MSPNFFLVDAFTSEPFTGNSAGVVLLEAWPSDEVMQGLARELALPATSFLMPEGDGWQLRWFDPRSELELCGHATLAVTHVLAKELGEARAMYRFQTLAGELGVKTNSSYELSLPRRDASEIAEPGRLTDALGVRPQAVYLVRKSGNQQILLVTLPDQRAVERLAPHQQALTAVGVKALMATAQGDEEVDFVCRYFVPARGTPEDSVTGSAYASLAPFWAERLGKTELYARQVSRRGGDLWCRVFDARVVISGEAVTVMRGELASGLLG